MFQASRSVHVLLAFPSFPVVLILSDALHLPAIGCHQTAT